MTDKNKKENSLMPSTKAPSDPMGLQERFNAAVLLTPTGILNALYGAQVRTAVKDFAVNVTDTVATVFTGFNTEKGDKAADWLKKVLDAGAAPVDGKFDFRMAKGWKMPEGVKYNGLLPSDPQYKGPKVGEEIKPTLSMFYRDKQGNIEVLDKDDARFGHIMGPYALTQVGLMATIGTKGLTSLRSALASSATNTGKVGTAVYLGLASADLYGTGAQITEKVNHSVFLKPEAIDRFAHMIDKPHQLTPTQILKDVKLILEEHAKKEGRNTTPAYIEAPTSHEQAMVLLDQMSKGQVKGYIRANPFADISGTAQKEDIHISNIREIRESAHFQRSFYKLATKALQGETMNESERLALRFGMNIVLANKDGALTVADSKSDFSLHANALKSLRGLLSIPILETRYEDHAKVKEKEFRAEDPNATDDYIQERLASYSQIWHSDRRNKSVPNDELLASVGSKITILDAQIKTKEDLEMKKIQAQAMVFSMQ